MEKPLSQQSVLASADRQEVLIERLPKCFLAQSCPAESLGWTGFRDLRARQLLEARAIKGVFGLHTTSHPALSRS